MEKTPRNTDHMELRAQIHDQDPFDTAESSTEVRKIMPKQLQGEDDENAHVEKNAIVGERLEFLDHSRLRGHEFHCPCSYPWRRFVSINRALHFFIPLSGVFFDRRPAKCSLHVSPSYTQSWLPPRWSRAQPVQIGVWWSGKTVSRVSWKTTRRISDNAVCFEAAKTGDIERVKDLLASSKFRLGDVAFSTGYTVLTWAVIKRKAEMVEFLVDHGADPYHDVLGFQPSPSHLAWDLWLRGLIPEEDEHMMRPLLDKSNYVDNLNLPVVHQIILGLSSRSFNEEMLLDPGAIHYQDAQKRTALSWAVACGRRRCVARLLKGGADPNIADKHNKTPLYLAVEYEMDHAFGIVLALLDAGAETDPELPHPQRSTPLLCTASNVQDLRILDVLLYYGAKVNAKNCYRQTALHIVARSKSAEHAALLLSYGAKLCVKDRDGKTALDIAVKHGNLDVLRLLMLTFCPVNPTTGLKR